MARIVIDARRIKESTGRYARELLAELQELDTTNDYHVIIHTKDQTHWTPKAKNFTLHVVPYDNYTFGEQIGFARFLYKLSPDLVHFTMPQQPLLYIGKRITTIHDLTLIRFKNLDKNKYVYAIEQTIFKFLIKNVAKRSKLIIAPSKYTKDDVVAYTNVKPDKVIVTHEAGTPLSNSKPKTVRALDGKEFILYVGNSFPHKNLERLVRAFSVLKEKHPDLHLALAGKREFFYEQLENNNRDVKNVHYLGFVPDEQLVWLYKHAQAYVFPSLSEGFGLPGLEVMHHGVPLVSSNATCLPEIYGDAAHYFDPESTDDIARAVDEVLRSKSRREKLVKNGFTRIKKFSWAKMTKKTLEAYVRIITK